jgi:prepilin-type N-terminal cleavage/methylation domain-containing protein
MSNKLKQLRASEGFTIIEVIIVLVIGAVIMLAVFLVVPQLQRTQRNSNRQNSARRVFTAAEQVNANTASYPTADGTGKTAIEAITGTVNAPSGSPYSWLYAQATTPPDNNTLYYTNNTSTCANNVPTATATSGKVVVIVANEGAASSTNWCVGN